MSRREVEGYLRMPGQPAVLFRLVYMEIVDDHMEFFTRIHRDDAIHEVQKLDPPSVVTRPD